MENKGVVLLFCIFTTVFAKEKSTQQEPPTSLTMIREFIDFSSLEVVDYLRFVALFIAFIAVVFYNCGGLGFRKGVDFAIFVHGFVAFFFPRSLLFSVFYYNDASNKWGKICENNCGGLGFRKGVDFAIFVHGFVAFFFPRSLLFSVFYYNDASNKWGKICENNCGGLGFRKGVDFAIFVHGFVAFFFPRSLLFSVFTPEKTDVAHEFIMQAFGIVLLSLVWANCYGSTSDQKEGAIILTRFMTLLGLVVAELAAYFGGQIKFNQKYLLFDIAYGMLLCLGHLYYIYRRGDFGQHTTQYSLNAGINIHLMVDLVIMTIACLTDLSYSEAFADYIGIPGWKIDPLHLHIVKATAIMEFSLVLYSVMALSFADDRDKRHVFVQRFIMLTIGVLTQVLYQLKHGLFNRNGFIVTMVLSGVMFVNTVWALYGNPVVALSNVASPQMVLRRKKLT